MRARSCCSGLSLFVGPSSLGLHGFRCYRDFHAAILGMVRFPRFLMSADRSRGPCTRTRPGAPLDNDGKRPVRSRARAHRSVGTRRAPCRRSLAGHCRMGSRRRDPLEARRAPLPPADKGVCAPARGGDRRRPAQCRRGSPRAEAATHGVPAIAAHFSERMRDTKRTPWSSSGQGTITGRARCLGERLDPSLEKALNGPRDESARTTIVARAAHRALCLFPRSRIS